ncbi:unnamed protein product [Chrysoparadoxa australica]
MEALTLVRECCMEGQNPAEDPSDKDYFLFGSSRIKKNTETAWKSKKNNQPLTVAELQLFLEYLSKSYGDYIRQANQRGLKFVSNVEKTELLSYLKGEISQSKCIQVDEPEAPDDGRGPDVLTGGMTEQELRAAKARNAQRLAVARGRAGLIAGGRDKEKSALYKGLSSDKLLELRAKHLSQKRQTIVSSTISSDPDAGDEGAVDPAFLAADKTVVLKIYKTEVRVQNRNGILRRQGKDFSFALRYYTEVRRKEKEMAKEKDDASYGKKRSRSSDRERHGAQPQTRRTNVQPIIVVPSVANALITLYNAQEFLQDGRYVPVNDKKAGAGRERKPTEAVVERFIPASGRKMTFRIIDNPTRLRKKDWDNVVCVLVQGAAWQFKGWEFDQPVTLFQHCLGVHVKYDDVQVDERVASWNVRILEVNKHKRHRDKPSSLEFWRMVDEFMLVHRAAFLKG